MLFRKACQEGSEIVSTCPLPAAWESRMYTAPSAVATSTQLVPPEKVLRRQIRESCTCEGAVLSLLGSAVELAVIRDLPPFGTGGPTTVQPPDALRTDTRRAYPSPDRTPSPLSVGRQ